MATSSNVATPSTATSPPPLAPAAPKQPSMPPGSTPQGSVTSKEWVIPPRPKPGRKPATDTPPTKRKAQNRAAQRAFRERRAARVAELEEQIKKMEEENARAQAELKTQIDELSKQLTDSRNEVLWWKRRCETLGGDLAEARRADGNSVSSSSNRQATGTVVGGCQNCSHERCQCIDDAFILPSAAQEQNDSTKRPSSPHGEASTKRQKSDPEIKVEPEELEIDFTHAFSARRLSHSRDPTDSVSPSPLFDPCGFCQDGTPCICAEMASEQAQSRPNQLENTRLPPIKTLSEFTPPPSEGDLGERLPSITSAKMDNPCANGPGTCAQCLADPRSTLFCKSLAASRTISAAAEGCCRGAGNGSGCCISQPSIGSSAASRSSNTSQSGTPTITLSCADTFTTLSRHPNFARASEQLDSWLPRLHTLPNPRQLNLQNRPALEVEAASVMGVLRYFDRRFAD